MSNPLVVTLDRKSAPRTIFAGDKLVEVDMPAGTRVLYPRAPLAGLKDVDAAIRFALNHPHGSEPLSEVTISSKGDVTGVLELAGGAEVLGVLGDPWLCEGRLELTAHGGWREYLAARTAGKL